MAGRDHHRVRGGIDSKGGALGLAAGRPAARTMDRGDDRETQIGTSDLYQAIKFKTFDLTLDHLDMKNLKAEDIASSVLREEISSALSVALMGEGVALNATERAKLTEEVVHEITGLGPLEPLLQDSAITDIAVNGPRSVYVEKHGEMTEVPVRFRDNRHLMNIIHRIVGPVGRRVDEANPFVDARLPDGSRVNVVIPPVALDGPMLSIRKFRAQPITIAEMMRNGSMSQEMLDYLARAVSSGLNILISGGTGSGKTTMLNVLSGYVGSDERLVTIEDAAELQLRQDHVVRLETRPATPDSEAVEVTARDLVKNALRMRPDRIILGEVRGAEAVDMLQAMTTGHDGSMATCHANSTRDALARMEMLLEFGGLKTDTRTLRRYIASAIQVVLQVERQAGGARRVTSIIEITGLEGDNYALNELFRFKEDPPLSGRGEFVVASRRPHFADRMVARPNPNMGDRPRRKGPEDRRAGR